MAFSTEIAGGLLMRAGRWKDGPNSFVRLDRTRWKKYARDYADVCRFLSTIEDHAEQAGDGANWTSPIGKAEIKNLFHVEQHKKWVSWLADQNDRDAIADWEGHTQYMRLNLTKFDDAVCRKIEKLPTRIQPKRKPKDK